MSEEFHFGWVDDPEEVGAIVGELEFSRFAETPAGQESVKDIPESVHGWKIYEKVTGKLWPIFNQGPVGSCVSFGTTNAMLYTAACEIASGEREEIRIPCMEAIYGGSRVEIGGGKLRGDGSLGAWAAKWLKQYGIVAQGVYGQYDLREYSVQRCREWGKSGLPDDLEPEAKSHGITDFTPVLTFENACKAIANGYGINVCSNQGFDLKRDEDGFSKASGSWGHSMAFIGYSRGARPGLFVVNSWGANSTTGPTPDDCPKSGWWVDASVADRMLRGGDSFCYSGFRGFPVRRIDWSVL